MLGRIICAGSCLLVLAATACAAVRGPAEATRPHHSARPSFPPPVLEHLRHSLHYRPTDTTFTPPAGAPVVGQARAVAIAERHVGAVHPAEVAATYVDVSAGGNTPRPVWIISFVGGGVCDAISTVPGAPQPSNDCAGNVADIGVDALTGRYMGLYSNGSADDDSVPPAKKTEADLLIGS